MKKLLLCFISALLIIACESDSNEDTSQNQNENTPQKTEDNTNNPLTNEELLVGKWLVESIVIDGDALNENDCELNSEETFFSDKTYTFKDVFGGRPGSNCDEFEIYKGEWSISGNKIILTGDDPITYTILELTETSLKYEIEFVELNTASKEVWSLIKEQVTVTIEETPVTNITPVIVDTPVPDNESRGCENLKMRDFFGKIVSECNYDFYDSKEIKNVYVTNIGAVDLDNNGTNDHYHSIVYITDGKFNTDINGRFESITDRTYMLEFSLYSSETSGLQQGNYIPLEISPSPFKSYINTIESKINKDCNTDDIKSFACDSRFVFINAIVSLDNITEKSFDFCFDTELSLRDDFSECFSGSFSGEFISADKLLGF